MVTRIWSVRSLHQTALLAATLAVALPALAQPTAESTPTNTPAFIRFTPEGTTAGRVETAVKTYRNPHGVEVTLFAAVHIGDLAYYQNFQQQFERCDALLYEMIRDPEPVPSQPDIDTSHPISQLQIGMKRLLALDFQLDAIDYTRPNFVHADLDPATFFRLQEERQESLLALMFRVMLEEQARINAGEGTTVSSFGLLMALMNPDRAYALKLVFGQQMDQLERMLAGIENTADGEGSVIVSARNKHALQIMQGQIDQGRRRLGIFYGAAHMIDFEQRLVKLGFRPFHQEWVTAWDIRPRSPAQPTPAP